MKLLLTSAGITNKSIANALKDLVGKPLSEVKVGFIPTAANVERGNKDWYIAQLTNLHAHGFLWVDIVDISAPLVDWKSRLSGADVIFVGGGNTFYLLDQIRKTKFDEWLKDHIDTKVYVGISAGSIIVTPSIAIASVDNGDENLPHLTDLKSLGFTDFEISPHTPEHVSHEGNSEYCKTTKNTLYGIDDQTAVVYVDGKIEVITEGEWVQY